MFMKYVTKTMVKAISLLLFVFSFSYSANTTAKQFKALLFTKTAGWHHNSVLEAVTAMKALSEQHFFQLDWHEDANHFNDKNLENYDVVIFLQTTGDVLNEQQQRAFKRFIQQGKGFVGIHSAADTEHGWPWYRGLVGHMFIIHPAVQTAKITVQDKSFPAMEFLPETFLWTDEYYHYSKAHSDKLNYILTVDEATYAPGAHWGDLKVTGMGKFHPIAWSQEYDGGRAFYTGLGHMGATYKQDMFLQHIYGGIYWAATGNK